VPSSSCWRQRRDAGDAHPTDDDLDTAAARLTVDRRPRKINCLALFGRKLRTAFWV
jgi:hypothetical protein